MAWSFKNNNFDQLGTYINLYHGFSSLFNSTITNDPFPHFCFGICDVIDLFEMKVYLLVGLYRTIKNEMFLAS